MRKTVRTNLQSLHNTLLSLGYKLDKEYHYRKKPFHVIVYPRNGRVDIAIHVNKYEPWTPALRHHSRHGGKDINRECQNIIRALNVSSRQASEQPKPRLQAS